MKWSESLHSHVLPEISKTSPNQAHVSLCKKKPLLDTYMTQSYSFIIHKEFEFFLEIGSMYLNQNNAQGAGETPKSVPATKHDDLSFIPRTTQRKKRVNSYKWSRMTPLGDIVG